MDTNKPRRPRWGMGAGPIRSRTRVPRLFASFGRLASLQWRIGVVRFRLRARQVLLGGVLLALAAVCAITGLIFLEVAIFQLLHESLPARWVAMIFAGVHLLIAWIVAMSARGVLSAMDSPEEAKK